MKISPFLKFSGQCAEAIKLYEEALKAKITFNATFEQARAKGNLQFSDEAQKDWIFHTQIKIGEQSVYMCDCIDGKTGEGTKLRKGEACICAEFDTPEEVQAAYEIMCEGGKIIEPMCSAEYSASFVFIEDKFGIRWWLMTAK